MQGPQKLLLPVNDSSSPYLGSKGIYGMMAKAQYKYRGADSAIFKKSNIRKRLFDSVEAFYREYPDHSELGNILFKVFNENLNLQEMTLTKALQKTKRGEIKGRTCKTFNESIVDSMLRYVCTVIQENIASIYPDAVDEQEQALAVMELMNQLGVAGQFTEENKFMPASTSKAVSCHSLRMLLMVANYYHMNDKVWFLNPITTNIYRPLTK